MNKHRGGSPRKTTEQFIKQSKDKFGEKFDYSKTVYKDCKTKLTIICPTHGEFSMLPKDHLRSPIGCPICSGKYLKSTQEFIESARRKHGEKFDYSVSDYKGAYKPVDIICKKHGVFQTKGWHHISQAHGGCPECFRESRSSKSRKPIYEVGINDGEIDAVHTRIYQIWHGMIMRCYNDKAQEKNNAYRGVSVCEDWLTFSSFLKWVESSESGYRDDYDIDKDILGKDAKLYSPDTCCFVHPRINKLLIKQGRRTYKGMDLPLGVTFSKGRYIAYCSYGDKIKNLGSFLNPDDAFVAYKTAKESYIKEVAQDYYNNGLMHIRIYNALMNYEISK